MIECQICLREFSDGDVGRAPRILTNCGHTLCEECAKRILVGNQITCPFDRKVTALGSTGVNGLPKNFSLLESLREATRTGIPCAENSSHEAVLYCNQCEIALCEICFAIIHRLKVFANHQRVHVSEKRVELPKCPAHPFNTAEFYCMEPNCKTPDKIMCHVCMTTELHEFHEYNGLRRLIEMNKRCNIPMNVEYYQDSWEECEQMYTDAIERLDLTGEMFQRAEKAITDTFDKGKKKALEELRSLSERKTASMKKVNDSLKENLRNTKELWLPEKPHLKSLVEQVDDMRKWRKIKDNVAKHKHRDEYYDFDGVGIFLPVMNLTFSNTWNEKEALENSGLVCVHHVTDYNRHNRSNE